MKFLITTTATIALAVALAAAAEAMTLQERNGAPDMGARQSNTYHGPGSDFRSHGGGAITDAEPDPETIWLNDQEVMRTRTGRIEIVVRIENISDDTAMVFSDGSSRAVAFSHGIYAVHAEGWPIYEPGEQTLPATGLESLAEDGNVRPMQTYLERHPDVVESGIIYKTLGSDRGAELWPGDVYEFHISADPGDKLSFATMLMQSNDIIYGPRDGRLELFSDSGRPISGDVTAAFAVFDAGTEVNEDPLTGPNVGMNQQWLNAGDAENGEVRTPDDGFAWPPASKILRVTLRPAG